LGDLTKVKPIFWQKNSRAPAFRSSIGTKSAEEEPTRRGRQGQKGESLKDGKTQESKGLPCSSNRWTGENGSSKGTKLWSRGRRDLVFGLKGLTKRQESKRP
jgi:hypothetical protein